MFRRILGLSVRTTTNGLSRRTSSTLPNTSGALLRQFGNTDTFKRSYVTAAPQQPQSNNTFNTLTKIIVNASIAGFFGGLTYLLYDNNVKKDVNDLAIDLVNTPENAPVAIINENLLVSAGDVSLAGRSKAKKVYIVDQEGKHHYFYHKVTFTRGALLNELVIGSLGKLLMGDEYPRVYAVQAIKDEHAEQAKFSLLSESLSGSIKHDNLENWGSDFKHDEEEENYGPKYLGVAVAFDMLVGKSDIKLANLVVRRGTGQCYSVDHESAFLSGMEFMLKAEDGVNAIGEFKNKQFSDLIGEADDHEFNANDNPYQPIKNDQDLKSKIKPILLAAIDSDIKNGKVMALYRRFVELRPDQLENLFKPYSTLIHPDEKTDYMQILLAAQTKTKKFLAEHDHDHGQADRMNSKMRGFS